MNADTKEAPDRGELVSLMEPMRISETSRHRRDLADLAVELAAHSTGFRRSLPKPPPEINRWAGWHARMQL